MLKAKKSSLAKTLSLKEGIPEYLAKRQVRQVIEILVNGILECEEVMISGLGTFSKKDGKIFFYPSKRLKNTKGEKGLYERN